MKSGAVPVLLCCLVVVSSSSEKRQISKNSASSNYQGKRDAYSGIEGDYNEVHGHGENNYGGGAYDGANLVQHVSQMIDDIYSHPNLLKDIQHQHKVQEYQQQHHSQEVSYPLTFSREVSYKPQYVTPIYNEKESEISSGHNNYFVPHPGSYESGQDYSGEHGHQLPIPYAVPEKHTIAIEKPVPYPVPVKSPYPVTVPQPYPVPVEKPIPYPVVKPVPYPVHYPVPVEHYNPGDAFKVNQEAFGYGNYQPAIAQYQVPQINYAGYPAVPSFAGFPLQFGNFNVTNCNCTMGGMNMTTTTMAPATTTRPANPKASLLAFLIRNLSSS